MSAVQERERVEAAADEAVADERGRGRRIMDEVRAAEQAHFDRLPMVARCGLCDWTFEGDAGAARSAQFEHRKTHARGDATNSHEKPARHVSQGTTAHDRREALQKMETQKKWTRESILEAFARWASERGKPPTSTEWNRNKVGDDFPPAWVVAGEFGKWSDGVKAAGLNGVPTGGPQRPARVATTRPAPESAPSPAVAGTLTVLAQAVDQAQVELDAAIARHADAVQALRDALEAT